MNYNYYVYIITNRSNNVLYTGVTNDLEKRIYQHRTGTVKGFTQRYNVKKLLYFESFSDIDNAIIREKQIKNRSRQYKINLVEKDNPLWHDLYDRL